VLWIHHNGRETLGSILVAADPRDMTFQELSVHTYTGDCCQNVYSKFRLYKLNLRKNLE